MQVSSSISPSVKSVNYTRPADNEIKTLESQKQKLIEQIAKVKESKREYKEKMDRIKELQDQITQVEEMISQKRMENMSKQNEEHNGTDSNQSPLNKADSLDTTDTLTVSNLVQVGTQYNQYKAMSSLYTAMGGAIKVLKGDIKIDRFRAEQQGKGQLENAERTTIKRKRNEVAQLRMKQHSLEKRISDKAEEIQESLDKNKVDVKETQEMVNEQKNEKIKDSASSDTNNDSSKVNSQAGQKSVLVQPEFIDKRI